MLFSSLPISSSVLAEMTSSSSGSTRTPAASMRARTGGKRQVNLFVEVQQALLFHFGAKHRREAQQKIGAFAGRAGKRAIQMAQDHFGEFVIRGGGAQQVGIKHGGVADSGDGVRR